MSAIAVPYVYNDAPLTTDPSVIKQNMVDYMTANMPSGWSLKPGSMIDILLDGWALQASQQADVAQTKLTSDFRYLGILVGVPPIDAVPSQSTVTFTVQDTAGYTISASDTIVGVLDTNGVLQGFDLQGDVAIAPGSTTGTGTVLAETPGTITNQLGGSAQIIAADPFVTGATMTLATGGIDAETDPVFLDRLVETLGTLTPVPVLGTNFAVLARSIAGVYRACGVNLLKPGSPYDGAAENDNDDKNVTVAVTDINGNDPGSPIRMATQTYLQSLREANFVVWVVAAQYFTIDVTAMDIYVWPGYDASTGGAVYLAALAAIAGVLNPATFATDPSGNTARWANDPVVHATDISAAVAAVPGVRNASVPTFGIHGGSMGTTDVTMGAGSAIPSLPRTGSISVTMHATTS